MAAWALAITFLKHLLPLPALARIMWKNGSGPRPDPERQRRVVRLADYLSRATNFTARGACLPRSLLAYRFLSELHADPSLKIAFRKNDARAIVGHAWVTVDHEAIGEQNADLDQFLPAVSFGPNGRMIPR